jgi:hypothetical protein
MTRAIEHADRYENIAGIGRLIADGTPIEGDQNESSQRQIDKDRGRSDQVERHEQFAEGRRGYDGRSQQRDKTGTVPHDCLHSAQRFRPTAHQ